MVLLKNSFSRRYSNSKLEIQSPTLRSITLRLRGSRFCEYLRENEFFRETILDCLSGTQLGWINKERKKCQKSRDTVSLSNKSIKLNPLSYTIFGYFLK